MELSIIVPIYNVEKYLKKCLDSILAQTFSDFELILVDDGSPDRCGEIIDEYACKDNRIVVIHQINKGVSAARNAALRIAKGKYVGFVDPDDYIKADMYSKMIESAKKHNADIVGCDFCKINESGDCLNRKINIPEVMSAMDFLSCLFDMPRTIGGAIWNKLFLREKITMEFDEKLVISEDWWFLFNYLCNINSASYVNEGLYYSVYRADSATHTIVFKNLQQIEVREKALRELSGYPSKVRNAAEADFLDTCVILYNQILDNYTEDIFICFKKIYCRYVKKNLFHILLNQSIGWKIKFQYFKLWFKF